jgi:hypothetical protein
MPSSTTRDQYVIGRCGSYLAPTLSAVDNHLRALRTRLTHATPTMAAKLRADIDGLLDRRVELLREDGQ